MRTSPFVNILLDRDGTIIQDRHYLSDPNGVRLLPGAVQGLQALTRAGCRLFIVTNQSGVARGYFSISDFQRVQDRLEAELRDHGIPISGQAACFHGPADACACRKPEIGLWIRLSKRYGLRPEKSLMIGDKTSDIDFARKAGLAASILVRTDPGQGTHREKRQEPGRHPSCIVSDLHAAGEWILGQSSLDDRA